jgi:hypothetical protein
VKPSDGMTRHTALLAVLLLWQEIISQRHRVFGGNPRPAEDFATERTAKRWLFFRCFSLFLRTSSKWRKLRILPEAASARH